jgi:hypothetical protein
MSINQADLILLHLKEGKSITPIDALEKFGCFRLAARISDLKQKGNEIKSEMVTTKKSRFARYTYTGEV